MPNYVRAFEPGGTFFFTLVTHKRRPIFKNAHACMLLGEAIKEVREAAFFEMPGFVILPDHLHCLWSLPGDDTDFSSRWSRVKRLFSKPWLSVGLATVGMAHPTGSVGVARPTGSVGVAHPTRVSPSRERHRELGVWQRRFWEHTIRDEADFIKHLEYIHFNPVKHGLVECPHAWTYSSFHRWVKSGEYPANWQCVCDARSQRRAMPEVTTARE